MICYVNIIVVAVVCVEMLNFLFSLMDNGKFKDNYSGELWKTPLKFFII